MKILYLITSFDYGGAQKSLFDLAKFTRSKGHDIIVVSVKKNGIYRKRFSEHSIPVYSLNLPNFSVLYLLKLPFAFLKIINLIKKRKIEIIHSFLFQANILGRIAAKICEIRNISTVMVMELEKKFQWIISRLTRSFVDRITVNSVDLISFLHKTEGVKLSKIVYIPNYINLSDIPETYRDVRMDLNLNKDDFVISSVGRLEEQKGYEYLIDAVGMIIKEIPSIKVLIVGDGSLRRELELKILKMNLVNNVFLLGAKEAVCVYDVIKSSDLFVLSSLWEGSPNVLLESVACGIPVIATDVSGVGEIIDRNYIVKPGSAIEIADKILYVYRNLSQVKMDIIKNKEKLEKFTSIKNLEKYLNLYESVLINQ